MKRVLFILSLLLLGGCFGGESAPSKFYTLQGESKVPVLSQTKMSVGVLPVKIPDYINRPQIVLNGKGNEMDLSEINRWIDSLTVLGQSVLITDLQTALPNAYVKTKGYDNERFNRLIQVEVAQMDGKLGQKAYLSAWWAVLNTNGTEIYRSRFEASESAGDSYETYARAQSVLWENLALRIASYLAKK